MTQSISSSVNPSGRGHWHAESLYPAVTRMTRTLGRKVRLIGALYPFQSARHRGPRAGKMNVLLA